VGYGYSWLIPRFRELLTNSQFAGFRQKAAEIARFFAELEVKVAE
jgi:hypothetical protein